MVTNNPFFKKPPESDSVDTSAGSLKAINVGARLTAAQATALTQYSNRQGISKNEAIVAGLRLLIADFA